MKMIWYPFLTVGSIFSFKTGNRGYFAAFVVCAVMAMLMQLEAFSIYQSFSGKSILILDIIIYVAGMLACDVSQKKWAQKLLPLWLALAVMITAEIKRLLRMTYWADKRPGIKNRGYISVYRRV